MKTLDSLYFPATAIRSIREYPLFLLIRQLKLLRPLETSSALDHAGASDIFIESDFCQVVTPCPLGEDLPRFTRLLSDICERKDDYASQLGALTLGQLGAKDGDLPLQDRLISQNIMPSEQKMEKAEDRDRLQRLWQARLLLCLAEISDFEEEQLAAELALLDEDTADLFASLSGDEEADEKSLFAELAKGVAKEARPSLSSLKARLSAWNQLYREARLEDTGMLVTKSEDLAEILVEKSAQKDLESFCLKGLSLPQLLGLDAREAAAKAIHFHRENKDLRDRMDSFFHGAATTPGQEWDQLAASFAKILPHWDKALKSSFPASDFGRKAVKIYIFKDQDCRSLLLEDPGSKGLRNGKNALLLLT